jgi:hypothetical protein
MCAYSTVLLDNSKWKLILYNVFVYLAETVNNFLIVLKI